MKIIVKTIMAFVLFLAMASCQEQEAAYKSKLNIKTEPTDHINTFLLPIFIDKYIT